MSQPRPDQRDLVCRCEEVTLEELRLQLQSGALSAEELKRYTRITMGPCQGRVCRPLLGRVWPLLLAEIGLTPGETAHSRTAGSSPADLLLPDGARLPGSRPPVRALRVGDLARLEPFGSRPAAQRDGKEGAGHEGV